MELALSLAAGRSRPPSRRAACRPAALLVALVALAPACGMASAATMGSEEAASTPIERPLGAAQPLQRQISTSPPDKQRPRPPAPALTGRYHPKYGRWWPGQTLPPDAAATVIADPEHYHLRRAPAGYVWLLCDGDLVLASSSSGLIVEVIPGGGA